MAVQEDQRFQTFLDDGIRHGRDKKFGSAVEQLLQAIELAPEQPDCHFNLGVAYRGLGQNADAVAAFTKAILFRAEWPEAWFNLSNTYRDLQERERSIECLEKAVQLRPNYLKPLNNLGNLYFEQGNVSRAEQLFRQAINADPNYAEGLFNLGRVLRRQKRLKDAIEVTCRAAAIASSNTRYRLKVAELQKLAGMSDDATKTLEDLRRDHPDNSEAVIQQVALLKERNKLEEATSLLNEAIAQPKFAIELLWQRAELLRLQQRYADALIDLDRLLQIDPQSAQANNLYGVVLLAMGEPERGLSYCDRAVAARPDFVEAYNNRGACLQTLQRYEDSQQDFETAVRFRPDFAIARLNHALCLMRAGNFRDGWREFEWRFLCPEYRMPNIGKPVWSGEPLNGRSILLRTEQGLGDTFQFIRYAKLVKDRGGRVIVDCQEPVCELVSRCPGVDQVVKRGSALPHVDVQIPLMSLPGILSPSVDSIPKAGPYLSASSESRVKWRDRLAGLGKLRVGVAWQGNRKFQADRTRSFHVNLLRPLAEIDGVALVSLQKNDGAEQVQSAGNIPLHDFGMELDADGPFCDTAAIIAECDLIVACDTAINHLAGAMGVPSWLALSTAADWRWLGERDRTVWYPTMRIFRQTVLNDWESVFERMAFDLRQIVQGRRDRLTPSRA